MDLSVVIVTWNSQADIRRCLDTVREQSRELACQVIVVDNASRDDTVDIIRREYPEVEVVASGRNLGFPGANNHAFRRARGRYVLALNPDTELGPDSLRQPVRFLDENAEYGCVGVKTYGSNGAIQYHCARRYPNLTGMLLKYFYLDKVFRGAAARHAYDMPGWDHEDTRDVDMVQGSYMLMRRSLMERLGGFDETLPMFLEDCEYCVRIRRSGSKIRYLAECSIIHHSGKSTEQARPGWIAELRLESEYLLIRHTAGPRAATAYAAAVLLGFPVKCVAAVTAGAALSFARRRPIIREYVAIALHSVPWAVRRLITPASQSTWRPAESVEP